MNGPALLFRDVLHWRGVGCLSLLLLALASSSVYAANLGTFESDAAARQALINACTYGDKDECGAGDLKGANSTARPGYQYVSLRDRRSGEYNTAYFGVGGCPEGTLANPDTGLCEPEDDGPEEQCPAAGEKRTVTVENISSDSLALLESSGIASDDGCTFSGTSGVSACLVNDDATVSCAITFTSDGTKGETGSGLTVPKSRLKETAPSPKTGTVETDLEHETSADAPDTTENSDGSNVTVVRETDVTRGPARATVSGSPGDYSGGATNGSTATTTTTTTTNNYSDGGKKVVKQEVNRWINGDSYTFTTNENGGVTVTPTPGTSGGSTTTTTTTTAPDGSTTTNTTTSNDASDIPNGVSNGTPNCVSGACTAADPGDGTGAGGSGSGGGGGAGDGGGDGSGPGDGQGEGEGEGEDYGDADGMFGGPCKTGESNEAGENSGVPLRSAGSGYDCAPTFSDSLKRLWSGVQEAPIYKEISEIPDQVPAGAGTCPRTSFDAFGETFEFNPGCDLVEQNRSVISSAAKAAWTVLAVVMFLGV